MHIIVLSPLEVLLKRFKHALNCQIPETDKFSFILWYSFGNSTNLSYILIDLYNTYTRHKN